MKLDVGASDLGGGDLDCAAVDFLFVIDNSSSMAREQDRLIEAVPGFTDSILSALPGISDVRVGVVDTDSYPGLGTDVPIDGCPDGVDCSVCDYTLGALLTRPQSAIDPTIDCGFTSGGPWMDARDPEFPDQFACVADVGIDGNQIEQQAGALVQSIAPAMLAGGCNDAFLRDDALLMILVITDEEDDHDAAPPPQGGSLGEPSQWYDAVIAAKGGQPTNAVVLALTGGAQLYEDCVPLGTEGDGAEAAPRLNEFFGRFVQRFTGSVCQGAYVEFFDDAVNAVAAGCAQFVPG